MYPQPHHKLTCGSRKRPRLSQFNRHVYGAYPIQFTPKAHGSSPRTLTDEAQRDV